MSHTTANLGTVQSLDSGYELRFERALNHPVEKVWSALSEPERLEEWLATASTLDLTIGGAIELRWQNTDLEGNYAVARGRITTFEPPKTIEYDTDIHGLIRWDLEPRQGGCLLRLTVRHELPANYLTIVLAGWHVHIDFLEDALNGQPINWNPWPLDRWETLHRIYEETLD